MGLVPGKYCPMVMSLNMEIFPLSDQFPDLGHSVLHPEHIGIDRIALLCQTDEVSYYLNLVGMSIWYDGTKEMIDGKECLVFVLGTEHEECIVRENYYAVSDNQVYYYDAINDAWNILGAG